MSFLSRFVTPILFLLAVLCACQAFAADVTPAIQIVRQIRVSAASYANLAPAGVRIVAPSPKNRDRERLAVASGSSPDESAGLCPGYLGATVRCFAGVLPRETDSALDAKRLAEFLPPLGMAESLLRTAGDRWIVTIADDLVIAESRDAGEALRFPLTSLLSSVGPSIDSLADAGLSYDRTTHRWALAAVANPGSESSRLLVAVSATSDPTAQWLISEIRPGAGSPAWTESPSVALSAGVLTIRTVTSDPGHRTESPNVEENVSLFETDLAALRPLVANVPAVTMSVSPSTGTGSWPPSGDFQLSFTDSAGVTDLSNVNLLINATLNGVNSCFVTYFRLTNQVGLLNDNSTAYLYPTPTSPVQNSQCILNYSYFYVNGNQLYGYVYLTFNPAFSGTKAFYLSASSVSTGLTPWIIGGAWNIPASNLPPAISSVSPPSGTSTTQTFTVTATDPNGASDISGVNGGISLLVNSTLNGNNACFVTYVPALNQIWLLNDGGTAWFTTGLGTGPIIQNSQCSVNAVNSGASTSFNSVYLSATLSFKPAFAGGKYIYASATDASGASSGWQGEGVWIVGSADRPPDNVSFSPSSGLGATGQFSFSASDPDGPSDLATVYVVINNVLTGVNACYFSYNFATSTIALYNDAGMLPVASTTLGSPTVLANSQCSLNLVNAFVYYPSGATVSGITISFVTPGFVGSKEVWMNAIDLEGASSGWLATGAWGIPSPTTPPFSTSLSPTSGSGNTQIFQAQYTDVNGSSRITLASMLLNSILNGTQACFVNYFAATNTFGLLNDAGNSWMIVTPGSNTTAQNSQCILNGSGSSASTYTYSPLTLTVNFSMTFLSGSFSGSKNVYMWTQDSNGLISGWGAAGTWTVP